MAEKAIVNRALLRMPVFHLSIVCATLAPGIRPGGAVWPQDPGTQPGGRKMTMKEL